MSTQQKLPTLKELMDLYNDPTKMRDYESEERARFEEIIGDLETMAVIRSVGTDPLQDIFAFPRFTRYQNSDLLLLVDLMEDMFDNQLPTLMDETGGEALEALNTWKDQPGKLDLEIRKALDRAYSNKDVNGG